MKMIEKHKKTYLYILFFFVFLSVSILISHKTLQNDTFYTIKVGEIISKYGVDMKDHFSFVPDLIYTYPHWLYDLLIYRIYSFSGFSGLYISCIVFTFILISTMFLTVKKIVNDDGIAFLASSLLSTFLSSFIAVRAQLISYIFILLVLYSIEMIRRTNKNRYLVLAFISSIMIVNMHCAVFYYLFLLFVPYLVSDLLYVIKNKFKKKTSLIDCDDSILQIDKPSNTKKLFIMMFLIFISGLIAPNAPTAYTYLPKQLMGGSMAYISEHVAPSIKSNLLLYVHALMFVGLLLIPRIKIKLHDMFMIIGLFIASFLSLRSFSLFIISTIYAYSRIIYKISYDRLKIIKISDIYRVRSVYIVVMIMALTAPILSLFFELKKDYVDKEVYPVEMTEYIKQNNLFEGKKILNEYNFGSYLLFNDIKVFIDSRSDLYMKEFNKDNSQFMDTMQMFTKFKSLKRKYDFDYIILYKKNALTYLLKKDKSYKLIKQDDNFVLYEKS